ncbi:MAG: L,D-transpeptidase [Ktedonobacterales bacterium]
MRKASRFPVVALMGSVLLVASVLLSSCTGQSGAALPTATAYPTVAYLPPTVTSLPTHTPSPSPPATRRVPPQPTSTPPPGPAPVGGVPQVYGQLILVSLSQQWLWAYQDRHLLYDTPVTSGMPALPTPDGTFYVHFHAANVTFISPWPVGSPYYYSPEHINYALYFLDDGYYIHDAPWRQTFGPGTNYPHTEPDGTTATGSHGCVNVPTRAGAWLYQWTRDGAAVVIYGTAPVPPPATATPKATATATPKATATTAPAATATATPTTPAATATPTP